MRLGGTLDNPTVRISSNLGTVAARSLRTQIGAEVDRVEQELRAEIQERIQPFVDDARGGIDELEAWIQERVPPLSEELGELRRGLERELAELLRRMEDNGGGRPQPTAAGIG